MLYNITTMMKVQKALERVLPKQVFLPTSWFMILWYFLVLIILALDFALTIVFICFRSKEANRALRDGVLPILTAVCFLDILITFNTSFMKNGQLVEARSQIFWKYMFSWYFFFDALALLVAVCQIILRYSFQDRLPFLNLLIMIKVVKGLEYDSLIKKYIIRSSSGLLYYAMVKNIVLLTFVCHIIGSFFFFLDLQLIDLGWYDDSMLWIKGSYAYLNIIDLPVFYQYSYGFYYAVVTLTGTAYGDLTPLNPSETAYTFMSVAMPMIIYAYLFSVIYNAIYERRRATVEATRYKRRAMHYFRDIGIPAKQSSTFMNYLSFVYDKKVAVDNEFMNEIGPSVRDAYFRQTIESQFDFSIFNMLTRPSLEISDIKELVYEIIEEDIYPEKQFLANEKFSSSKKKLYFITSGAVSKIIALNKKYATHIGPMHFFGMFQFFTGANEQTQGLFYETTQFTITQTIQHRRLMNLLRQPKNDILFESYHVLRDTVLVMQETEVIREVCFFCESPKHMIACCSNLRPNIEISSGLQRQQRRSMWKNRKNFSSPKILYHKLVERKESINQKQVEKGIQTEIIDKSIKTRLQNFEKVYNWKIFCPTHSF